MPQVDPLGDPVAVINCLADPGPFQATPFTTHHHRGSRGRRVTGGVK